MATKVALSHNLHGLNDWMACWSYAEMIPKTVSLITTTGESVLKLLQCIQVISLPLEFHLTQSVSRNAEWIIKLGLWKITDPKGRSLLEFCRGNIKISIKMRFIQHHHDSLDEKWKQCSFVSSLIRSWNLWSQRHFKSWNRNRVSGVELIKNITKSSFSESDFPFFSSGHKHNSFGRHNFRRLQDFFHWVEIEGKDFLRVKTSGLQPTAEKGILLGGENRWAVCLKAFQSFLEGLSKVLSSWKRVLKVVKQLWGPVMKYVFRYSNRDLPVS